MVHARPSFLFGAILLAGLASPPGLPAGDGDRSLRLVTSASWFPGIPVFVRVEVRNADGGFARDLWDAEATLAAPGFTLSPNRVVLRNGLGSALVTLTPSTGSPDAVLTATSGALETTRAIASLAGQLPVAVSGTLTGPVTEWSGVVHVTGAVTVPAGATLRVLPGTLVLVNGVLTDEGQPGECDSPSQTPSKCGVSITVRGAIESLGTEEEPVTFTAFDPARAWGQIDHDGASPSLYRFTFVTRGGNSPRGGHSNTGPAFEVRDSTIRFEGSAIADTAGKSMRAEGSDLEFVECLLTRSIMGPEIDGTRIVKYHWLWGSERSRGTS
jgi:hypothetical protein